LYYWLLMRAAPINHLLREIGQYWQMKIIKLISESSSVIRSRWRGVVVIKISSHELNLGRTWRISRADVSFNVTGKRFARPRVNCESKAGMSNYAHRLLSAQSLLVILPTLSENLAALIESPAFRKRAFCTRVVDKRTFPGGRFLEESFTRATLIRVKEFH